MKHPIKKCLRKIINRSGKQRCPICNKTEILVEHHINGRDIPNANNPSNLAYICDNDHRKIHEGKIIIEGHFMTSTGLELLYHSVDEESFTGQDSKPYIIS